MKIVTGAVVTDIVEYVLGNFLDFVVSHVDVVRDVTFTSGVHCDDGLVSRVNVYIFFRTRIGEKVVSQND